MKKNVSSLAIFGGVPTFASPLTVGPLNYIDWERFETVFRGIFSRRYYTNHGPLSQELESKLCGFFGVKHVVCVTNATIGLMIAAKALEIRGKVVVPAFAFPGTVQSLTWAGLEPVFCDVSPETHQLTPELVEPLLDEDVSAILGVHLWGNACDPFGMAELARAKRKKIYFDAAHSFGGTHNCVPIGGFGDMEVFTFHAANMFNATEGGCVTTNDDLLAARLRNIRSSYGAGEPVPVSQTSNGRMSEAQAALALLSMEDYHCSRRLNQERFEMYAGFLNSMPGVRFVFPRHGEICNYQYVVAEIDADEFGLSRDDLMSVLEAENIFCQRYFAPGMHRCPPYNSAYPQYVDRLPATEILCRNVMQVPCGQKITPEDIQIICELIVLVRDNAIPIREKIRSIR